MISIIEQTLAKIEREHRVKIIYAAESGSRAWGFASPDSDYDVRYIYVRRPEDYLRIDSMADTIEGPLDDVLDFSGWDVRKALELLTRTNPSLMEWAQSPIVYRTSPEWESMKTIFPDYFNPMANMLHYLSMTTKNWQKHMQGEQVKLKRYFYVLRPLLCGRWLEQFRTVPPVPFSELCAAVLPAEMSVAVDDLLQRKRNIDETGMTAHIPEIDEFILSEMPRIEKVAQATQRNEWPGYGPVNETFFRLVREAWK